MAIYRLADKIPSIDRHVFIAPEAVVIGLVAVGRHTSIWPCAVLRGDIEEIRIGKGCNIQDGAVLHTDAGCPLMVADRVTIGHQAVLHGCTIGAGSLVGMQAVVLNGAVIGHHSLVAAGAVVTQGKIFPDNSLILGAPARVVRELNSDEIADLERAADDYTCRGEHYLRHLERIS